MLGTVLTGFKGINVLTNLVSSILYDIGKSTFISIKEKRSNKMVDDLEKLIKIEMPEDYIKLSESGIVIDFINGSQVRDSLYYLICLKLLNELSSSPTPLFRQAETKALVYETDIYTHLSLSFMKKYQKETVREDITNKEIYDYLMKIVEIAAKFVLSEMENSRMVVTLINEHFTQWGRTIYNKLNNIENILKETNKYKIIDKEEQYEAINKEYMSCLRENNSKAHIYLLDTFDFTQFYVPPMLACLIEDRIMLRRANIENSWEYIFESGNIIYITGGAGYGKSLFMKNIINNTSELSIPCVDEYIIIYGELKSFFYGGSENPISVMKFLQSSIVKETLIDESKITIEFIEYYLKRGRCIILLDALDEVEQSKRKGLHKKVVNFFKNQNPNNKVCITSRNRGFIPESNILCYNIMPLSEKEIDCYVDKIINLGKFDKKDKESFISQTKQLVQNNFLNSFLVLSLLLNIYRAEREVPENKLELYQKCFEFIANKREKEKSSYSKKWKDIGPLMKDSTFIELAELCYPNNTEVSKDVIKSKLIPVYTPKFGNEINAENGMDEFLDFCSDRTELFVPASGEDMFRFFHRSFFEYFYSQYIFTRCVSAEEIYSKLADFDVDSEVFELTIAMLKQKSEDKYQQLIEYVFEKIEQDLESNKPSYIPFNILTLGMQVIDDKLYKDKYANLFIKHKEKFINSELENEEVIISNILQDEQYIDAINNEQYFSTALSVLKCLKRYCKARKAVEIVDRKSKFLHYDVLVPIINSCSNIYIKFFVMSKDLEQWIDSLTENQLTEIWNEMSPTKKEWYGIRSSVKRFKSLDKAAKDFVIKSIEGYLNTTIVKL